MKIKLNKILLITIVFMFVLAFFGTICFAVEDINPGDYKTDVSYGDATYIFNKGAGLLRVLRNFAAVLSVASLTIIGFRYMVGSVEQKAEYKQTMMPVVIACIFIASLSAILTLIQSIVK